MNWGQARKLLRFAVQRQLDHGHGPVSSHRGEFVTTRVRADPGRPEEPGAQTNGAASHNGQPEQIERAVSVCVVSGKGGTGKSVLSSSLSTLLARGGSTLIVDADLGIGNAHILQGVSPDHSFIDVTDGRLSVSEIVQE